MTPTLYRTKKMLLRPHTMYMRHIRERAMTEPARTIFELHYYRPAVYDFVAATMRNPDILVDVGLQDDSTVIDAGAYVGDWAGAVLDRYRPTIHAFEPAPFGVAQMTEAFADEPRVHVHGYGLGAHDGRARLALAGPGSSIYTEETPFGLVDIELRDIVSVLDELDIDRIDLLKVNIEGGEYDLLERLLDTSWLTRIDGVLVQFHEWHPGAYRRRRRIRRRLRQTHDEVWNFPWVWEYWVNHTDNRRTA